MQRFTSTLTFTPFRVVVVVDGGGVRSSSNGSNPAIETTFLTFLNSSGSFRLKSAMNVRLENPSGLKPRSLRASLSPTRCLPIHDFPAFRRSTHAASVALVAPDSTFSPRATTTDGCYNWWWSSSWRFRLSFVFWPSSSVFLARIALAFASSSSRKRRRRRARSRATRISVSVLSFESTRFVFERVRF